MTLFRACYVRDGFPRGVTFSAADLVEALWFSDFWEKITKCPVLTLKQVGRAKFTARGKLRQVAASTYHHSKG